ncbi:MAG: leucine-rich repeat domain-containing protein [Treponematales bacterium]
MTVTRAGYSGAATSAAAGPVAISASVTTTAANLASVLTGLAANTADSPYTIALAEGTNISNDWEAIYTEIRWRVSEQDQKYIILDLSACTATGNTITIGTGGDGTGNHPGNGFNIIGMIEHIKGVVLPDTLTSIGDDACYGCGNLTSVVIGNSVTSIGERAFNCTGLTSVTIPNSVTSIGEGAFGGCPKLTSVTIPGSVESIGQFAFQNCTSLTSVTIENGVTSIGDNAFGGWGLVSVTFGTGSYVFEDNFFGFNAFPEGSSGDGGNSLREAYLAETTPAGTYTREPGGSEWTKQQ